jgi:carboxyvinyl-carboxyphosphonate phosphorylmutase
MQLLSLDEGVGKIKAALSARADTSLTVVGRTSAIPKLGLDEAILRGKAYEAEGVDAMFYTGVSDKTEIEALAAALDVPIFLGGSGEGILADTEYLISQNVRVSLQGHQSFRAAVQAAYTTLKLLREGKPPSQIPGQPSENLMTVLTDDEQYQDWMREFLGN